VTTSTYKNASYKTAKKQSPECNPHHSSPKTAPLTVKVKSSPRNSGGASNLPPAQIPFQRAFIFLSQTSPAPHTYLQFLSNPSTPTTTTTTAMPSYYTNTVPRTVRDSETWAAAMYRCDWEVRTTTLYNRERNPNLHKSVYSTVLRMRHVCATANAGP
jgi:hypothetical protein